MIRTRLALALLPLTALASACGTPSAPEDSGPRPSAPAARPPGDAAVWFLAPDRTPAASSTSLAVLVSRLDCNSGVTGEVLPPEIRKSESEIVVTFAVAPRSPGAASCQSNNQVPYEVDLGEPIGRRSLIDGECLPGGQAATTSHCASGPRRHPG